MEPLLDLSDDWKRYRPLTDGYTQPPPAELNKVRVIDDLQSLCDLESHGTILGAFSISDTPNPCILVGGKTLGLPFSESGYRVFPASLQSGGNSSYYVAGEAVQLRNTRWSAALGAGVKGALASMKVNLVPRSNLAHLAMVSAPAGQPLNLRQSASKDHFATILAFLPFDTSTSATVNARKAAPFSTQFIVLYTGTDEAIVKTSGEPICFLTYHIYAPPAGRPSLHNLSRSRPEISRGLAAWRYALQTAARLPGGIPDHIVYHLDGDYYDDDAPLGELYHQDELVLKHLAPAAKYYEFDILFAHSTVELSCEWERYREYKEYYDTYNAVDHCASRHGGYETKAEWTFRDLNGCKIGTDGILVKKLNRAVKRDGAE